MGKINLTTYRISGKASNELLLVCTRHNKDLYDYEKEISYCSYRKKLVQGTIQMTNKHTNKTRTSKHINKRTENKGKTNKKQISKEISEKLGKQ